MTISGGTTAATATATVSTSTVVTGFTNVTAGADYTTFAVALSGGGGTGATAIGSGGVDAVNVTAGGSGYSMPTVDFDFPDDPNGTQATAHVVCVVTPDVAADCTHAADVTVSVDSVVVDTRAPATPAPPGSRSSTARRPTRSPWRPAARQATATSTLALSAVNVLDFGTGYASAPTVDITDPQGTGTGASATAVTDGGAITAVTVDTPGEGYLTPGMRKFVDELPMLCSPADCPATGKYLPTALPEAKKYTDTSVTPSRDVAADEYVIGLVQYRTSFSSDLPPTLVRGYVQLETPANASVSKHFPLHQRERGPDQGRHPGAGQRSPGLRRDSAAVPRADHRGHQGQAGPDRLPQPAADRCRR